MSFRDPRGDAELLATVASGADPEAFGVFYRRHVDWVLRVAARRTGSSEHAADLTAETFAAALLAAARYKPERGDAGNWLYGILLNKLAGFERRGAVEQRARRRLELQTPILSEEEYARVLDAAPGEAVTLLEELPVAQRTAVRGRIIEERPYQELAARLGTSETNTRKLVSRGLATLRAQLGKERL